MRNLFVPHTQYNIMISIALIEQQYLSDENVIVLFTDFSITDEMKKFLSEYFDEVLLLHGTYPAVNKKWSVKAKRIPEAIDKMKNFLHGKYDRLFWVCDTAVPEIWLLKELHSKNNGLEIRLLEDGALAYFLNYSANTGLNKNKFTRELRKCVGKIRFGKYYSYKDTNVIGSSMWNQEYCLTYPKAVRSDFADKPAIKIYDEYFQTAVKKVYGFCEYEIKDGSILILMDKLDVYKDMNAISAAVEEIVKIATANGKAIFYKYHPREESNLPALSKCNQISKSIGVEGIYANNLNKKIKVIGIKSTGLQTALKSGFDVASIAILVGEENKDLLEFYAKIGIKVIDKMCEVGEFLE